MRKRIVASLIGSVVGLFAAILIDADLGIPPTAKRLLFCTVGLLLGSIVSILMDVFSASTATMHQSQNE